MALVPQEMFFTKGVGKHRHNLQSFEMALRDAGIAHCNLVRVSSIFPPKCKIISRQAGIQKLEAGQITHCVLAETRCDEPGRLIVSGIGLAMPSKGNNYGYISEHHGFGMTAKACGDLAEDMAATMLASTLGIEFDPDKEYDERREVYRMSGQIVRTQAVVQTAKGDPNGLWTTVLSAAVFLY